MKFVAESRDPNLETFEYRCPLCNEWSTDAGIEARIDQILIIHARCPNGHAFDVGDGQIIMIDPDPIVDVPRITERYGIHP